MNSGWIVQRDLRLELPSLLPEPDRIYVNTAYELVKMGNRQVLKLGVLHPGWFKLVSFTYPKGSTYADIFIKNLEIFSEQSKADYSGNLGDEFDMPTWWYWTMCISIGCFILYAVYRVFETPPLRFLRLTSELQAEKKKLAKQLSRIQKLRNGLAEIPDQVRDEDSRWIK